MKLTILSLFVFLMTCAYSQEHGFLPGKKFPYYHTLNKYNLKGLTLNIQIYDYRNRLKLKTLNCSAVQLTNTSEFEGPYGVEVLSAYMDSILPLANINIDDESKDSVQIRLEGLDARMIGFLSIRVHGLCQIKIKYQGVEKTYCIDITDKDEHSPISSNAIVTREYATRVFVSAAIREVLEQFLADLQSKQ